MPPINKMVHVEHLIYEYPGLRALDDVSFAIAPGSITALVGPNGAGKTTLLRCMAGLEQPLDGNVTIDGIDVLEHPRECHRRIGYLSDFYGLYDALTVRQCLHFAADSQGVATHAMEERIVAAAHDVGLVDRLDARASDLSRGLRQRLAIGQAIIHAPKLLLLDEPASGLDPEARHALSVLLRQLRDRGMTLIVSSHILAELEEYCTEMLILRAGRVIEQRDVSAAPQAGMRLRVELSAAVPQLRERLATLDPEHITIIDAGASTAVLLFRGDAVARHALLKRMLGSDLPVCGFAEEQLNLQDAYLATIREVDSTVDGAVRGDVHGTAAQKAAS